MTCRFMIESQPSTDPSSTLNRSYLHGPLKQAVVAGVRAVDPMKAWMPQAQAALVSKSVKIPAA